MIGDGKGSAFWASAIRRGIRHGGAGSRTLAGVLPMVAPDVAARVCARAGLGPADGTELEAAGPEGLDLAFYQREAGRAFRTHGAALIHYLLVGSRRGLRPHPGFDPAYYRQANPDVAAAGYEPFGHYLRYGRHEGRGGTPEADAPRDLAGALLGGLPDPASMRRPRNTGTDPRVDVVIPVHGGRGLTLAAIDSVLTAPTRVAHDVVVVDDASPDPLLSRDLQRLAEAGLITLLRNERNSGFVMSVNRGIALHPDRDVVLLNSDTRVFGDWLDRLVAALSATPRAGTVTPLSNAATIVSYPVTLRDNSQPLEIGYADLDALCARLALPAVEVPTAVGFCMAIKRRCLEDVGLFDVVRFGRGYGEENDFCMRAGVAGWRHLAAPNLFVWHRGGASFGEGRNALIEAAQATIEELHPGYRERIHAFIRQDSLQPARASIDAARVAAAPRPKILGVARGRVQPAALATGLGDTGLAGGGPDLGLDLDLVRDIEPYSEHFRMAVRGFGAVPNIPRVGKDTPREVIVETIRALAIGQVSLHAPRQALCEAEQKVVSAAGVLGLAIRQLMD